MSPTTSSTCTLPLHRITVNPHYLLTTVILPGVRLFVVEEFSELVVSRADDGAQSWPNPVDPVVGRETPVGDGGTEGTSGVEGATGVEDA